MDWQEISLTTPGPEGYAPTSRPIGETITARVKELGGGRLPAVVWLRDGKNGQGNAIIAENLRDERVAIALERFLCLSTDLKTLPDKAEREKQKGKLPALLFFDPAGKPLASLTGRRATSRAALTSIVGKLWKLSFTLSQRAYTLEKDDILDRRENIDRRRQALMGKARRAAGKPAKIVPLKRDIKELEKQMREVLVDDRNLAQSVKLREKYRSTR